MAQGIVKSYDTGNTLYQQRARIRGTAIQIQNPTTGEWATDTAHADSAKEAVESTGNGLYFFDLSDLPQDWYILRIFLQAGASPAADDTLLDSGMIHCPPISPMMLGSAV